MKLLIKKLEAVHYIPKNVELELVCFWTQIAVNYSYYSKGTKVSRKRIFPPILPKIDFTSNSFIFILGGRYAAPYVDKFGEHDQELRRGNPLFLNGEQYEKYVKMWQNNDIQTLLAKSPLAYRLLTESRWERL